MRLFQNRVMIFCLLIPVFSTQVFGKEVLEVVDSEPKFRKPSSYYNNYQTVPVYSGPPPEISDSARNKYYDFNMDGIEDYLKDLEKDEPQIRGQLQPEFDRLKSKSTVSKIVLWSSIAVGSAIVTGSFLANSEKKMPSVSDPSWNTTFDQNSKALSARGTGAAIGIGIGLIGVLSSVLFIAPSNGDIRKFVNKNNELSTKHQLKLKNLSLWNDSTNGTSVALSFSF